MDGINIQDILNAFTIVMESDSVSEKMKIISKHLIAFIHDNSNSFIDATAVRRALMIAAFIANNTDDTDAINKMADISNMFKDDTEEEVLDKLTALLGMI